MKSRLFNITIMILTGWCFVLNTIQAQPTRTGTNLNSKAIPSKILMLHRPDEIETIRQFLIDGKKKDALLAAENYISEVERTTLSNETSRRYYAWNAYCTVLTSLRDVDEAISACSTAIDLEPGKWSAVNNRGTAKFIGGRLVDALIDYQQALSMVAVDNKGARATIEHNINLLQTRL